MHAYFLAFLQRRCENLRPTTAIFGSYFLELLMQARKARDIDGNPVILYYEGYDYTRVRCYARSAYGKCSCKGPKE